MPSEKDGDSEHTPDEIAGPSHATPDSSTSSGQPLDKPSSVNSVSPAQFYGSDSTSKEDDDNDDEDKPGNPKKRRVQRVARINHENDDIFGFDETSSSDSNITIESGSEDVDENEEYELEEEEENADEMSDDERDWFEDEDEDDILDLFDPGDEETEELVRNNMVRFGDVHYPELSNPFELSETDDEDSDAFDLSMELLSDAAEEDTSEEDSDLPDDPFEREILGSIVEPNTTLHLAAMKGDIKSLGRWQAWGTGIWARKVKGDTELHCAARSGDVATVEYLIKTGAELSKTNKKRHTPLEVAALCGHATVVKTLLKHGAGNDMEQMEHALLATKSASVVDALAEANKTLLIGVTGVDVLSRAARDGRVLLIRALLKGGADANWPGSFSRTALHTAASRGHVRCLLALLESNADVRCVDDRLWTPLHYAAYHSHRECVRALLAAGANPNARSGEGQVPYDVAFDEEIHRQLENA